MNQQVEAMKLAKAWFEQNTYGDEAVDVYEALCEALAEQPAQQQEQCLTCGEYEPRTGTCGASPNDKRALCNRRDQSPPAQPQQEPVACKDCGAVIKDGVVKCVRGRSCWVGQQPAQRKPLTDELEAAFKDGWQSAKASYGIKEQP